VARRLTQALHACQQGLLPPPERETLGRFLLRFLEDVARPSLRPTTYEAYERLARLHILPQLGQLRLARLTAQELQSLYARLLEKGLSPKTVALAHAFLHRVLGQAVRWGLLAQNPADAAEPPRAQRPPARALTPEEAGRLLEAARSDRLYALYVLAVTCGLRQAELLGLRWKDVDLEEATLAVRQRLYRVKGRWVVSEPKTARGRRLVTLPALAVQALRQLEERLRAGELWEENGLVFANQLGRPIEKQNLLRRSFWPLLERAGLPRIRFHDLRHTAASLLLSQGVHPKVVQERLGHATIAITMDTYSHVMPSLQREAAARLDSLLGDGADSHFDSQTGG
jgi:integrase